MLEGGSCIDGPEPSKPLSQGPYKRGTFWACFVWADKQLFLSPESGVRHSLLTSL